MTEQIKYPRGRLLKSLYEAAVGLGLETFVTSRPAAVPESLDRFAVVRISQPIRDGGGAHQTTYCQLHLFARDRAGTIEATDILDEMQEQAMSLFPLKTDLFSATSPVLIEGGSDEMGFHTLIIQAEIMIDKEYI